MLASRPRAVCSAARRLRTAGASAAPRAVAAQQRLVARRAAAATPGGDDAPGPSGSDGAASGSGGDAAALAAARGSLERLFSGGDGALTGPELIDLIRSKYGGRSYEARIARRGERVYLHIMWKFMEQQSFHLTKEEYEAQMAAVADVVSEWGAADIVRRAIKGDKSRGPGYSVGGGAKAVSIPLPVSTQGERSREWRY